MPCCWMVIWTMIKLNEEVYTRSSTYRKMYFKYNPGIFNKWYLCAYCRKKFLEKDIVQVDHIVAVNYVKKNPMIQLVLSILHTTVNDPTNLCAACAICNNHKKDKGGKWIIQGAYGKIQHLILQDLSQMLLQTILKFWYVYLAVIGAGIYFIVVTLKF